MPIIEKSSENNQPAIVGEHADAGAGVNGKSRRGNGVLGQSEEQAGVAGLSNGHAGIWGETTSQSFPGVVGKSVVTPGVNGTSTSGSGVLGQSQEQAGVVGLSNGHAGVWGETRSAKFPGVMGKSTDWDGVTGISTNHTGMAGVSDNFIGIRAENKTRKHPALFAKGPRLAARFEGDVEVTGDVHLVNADCAEDFDIADAEPVDPGTIMVLTEEGALRQSQKAYDRRVVGVISGAGNYRPGIVLDRQDGRPNRQPVTLLGKAYCKADASYGPIDVGDLLTTSPTPGHAMKADDPLKAFGAVIGKTLRPLKSGRGLIPILIALQ